MEINEITRNAIKAAGGARALGERLGITQQAVQQWRRVPAGRCREVEQITGISVHDLRPDVFGPERGNEYRAA